VAHKLLTAVLMGVLLCVGVCQTAFAASATSTLLPSGQYLQTGGTASQQVVSDLSLYDPVTQQTTAQPFKLVTARAGHSATVLPDGKILILGGVGQDGFPVASIEIIDLGAQTLQVITSPGLIARSQHRATLLTDGKVLITGGLGANGQIVSSAELWNPQTQAAEALGASLLTARYNHIAQVLADSPVLINGGQDATGKAVTSSELYDTQSQRFGPAGEAQSPNTQILPAVAEIIPPGNSFDINVDSRIVARFNKPLQVTTLNNATVNLLGPNGLVALKIVPAEAGMLLFVTPTQALLPGSKYTLFINGATDPQGQRLPFTATSFKTAAIAADNSDSSVGIVGISNGSTANAAVAGAGNTNTNSADITNPTNQPVATVDPDDAEEWIPGPQNYKGEWRSGRAHLAERTPPKRVELDLENRWVAQYAKPDKKSERAALALKQQLQAYTQLGVTALSGQVLKLNGRPLPGVTLSMGAVATVTDTNGEFVLNNAPAGSNVLVIDGHTANQQDRTYGRYEYLVHVETGKLNPLDHPIWMTKLDTKNSVKIASPTTRETVITNPKLPGLELRIPPGSVIRDASGHIVSEVSITPVPADQLPFPMPYGELPVYFTIQPGGAVIQSASGQPVGATLIYPNYSTQPRGARFELFGYDPYGRGWYSYGVGKVSDDGKFIKGEKDFLIYQFKAAGAASSGGTPAAKNPKNCTTPDCRCPAGKTDSDPVSCHDGLFLEQNVDLSIKDVVPITLSRVYRNEDANQRAFGVGASGLYDMYLYFVNQSGHSASAIDVVLANGGLIEFTATGTSTDYTQSSTVYESLVPGQFYKAQLSIAATGYGSDFYVTFKDKTRYAFSFNNSRLKWMEDRWGNRTTITRDSSNRISQIMSPNGRYLNLEYLATSCTTCVTKATDPSGRFVSYGYDSAGHLSQVTDPENGVTTYNYDGSTHRMLTVNDPRNNAGEVTQPKVSNTYYTSADGTNLNGRVKQQIYADATSNSFTYTFDSSGNNIQTEVTHERGDVRRIEYNTDGFITRETLAVGKAEQQVTTNIWDPATKLLTSTTDNLGRVTAYTYDSMGNVKTLTRMQGTAEQAMWGFSYEPTYNQVTLTTDPLNRQIQFSYDSLGNLTEIKNLGNNTRTSMTYTVEGQPQTQTAYVGSKMLTTTYTYDGGDLVAVSNPLGKTVQYFTDSLGRVAAVTDPMNNITFIEYDNLDRIKKSTNPLSYITAYSYDPDSNLKTLKDANTHTTSYTYDARNRVSTMTDPLFKTETYNYDNGGNLIRITDRKGQVTGNTYDSLNRRTQTGFGATSANPTAYTRTVDYSFDGGSRLYQIIDSQNGTLAYGFDGYDRVKQEAGPSGQVNYTYYANGLRNTMTVLGQPSVSYGYDNGNRPTQIVQGTQSVGFGFDDANRRTSVTLSNGVLANYTLDDASQVKAIQYTKAPLIVGDLSYAYDDNGRRIQMGGSLARGNLPLTMNALYDAANRIAQFNGTPFSHDDNGNLLNDGKRAYVWNSANQLAQLSGSANASFQYDPIGRRLGKTINGTQTGFLFDGINPVQELTGTTPKANLLTGGVDEYFARTDTNGTQTYLTDALGSILGLTDANGNVTTQYTYEAYGKTTASGAANDNAFQYTGRENDGTGLYFYRARYYDPETSRFISEDPIGLAGGINGYAYVDGDPISNTDPEGLLSIGPEAPPGTNSLIYIPPGQSATCSSPSSSPSIFAANTGGGSGGGCALCNLVSKALKPLRIACLLWCLAEGKRPPPEPPPVPPRPTAPVPGPPKPPSPPPPGPKPPAGG
jgi:RHS repeat-associated protein